MMVLYLRRKIKLKYILSIVCLIGIVYTIYQIRSVQELTKNTLKTVPTVRGVHMALFRSYQPDINNRFYCLSDGKSIHFDKVNDDYCDCEDGSDEPGTEACPNGKFYCTFETHHRQARPIPSSRVNDGICDCCDGSDEWKKMRWSFTSPCSNVC